MLCDPLADLAIFDFSALCLFSNECRSPLASKICPSSARFCLLDRFPSGMQLAVGCSASRHTERGRGENVPNAFLRNMHQREALSSNEAVVSQTYSVTFLPYLEHTRPWVSRLVA